MGPADPEACAEQTSEAACLELGCLYVDATLFEELVCTEGVATKTCVWTDTSAGFQSPSAWRRDTADGRLVLTLAVIPSVQPVGYEMCAESYDYPNVPCECVEP